MVEAKMKDQKAEVTIRPDQNIIIQEEIVYTFVSILMAFKERVASDGCDPADADKDADIILNRAAEIYHLGGIKAEKKPPVGDVAPANQMNRILEQVDDMLQGTDQKRYLS